MTWNLSSSPDEAAVRILLVDDQPLTERLVRQMLTDGTVAEWRLDYLRDPRTVAAQVQEIAYDVILLDLVMPDWDGFALLQQLRGLPETRQVPIVMLTSTEDAVHKARAFTLGANDYLIKLPDTVELLARLRYYGTAHRAHLRQQAAERALLDREAHLQAILDNALLAIITMDRTGQILDVNPAATQLLGYPPAAMVGQPMARFIRSEPFWSFYARLVSADLPPAETVGPGNKMWHVDGWRENGKQVDLEMAIVATSRAGERFFTAFLNDVTDHKQLLKSLEETLTVAETTSRVKSDFLATMSHEIRTPMNAVIGLTALALQTELSPRTQDYLTKIRDASHALLRIINDILDFSRMDAGGLQLEVVPFQWPDLFDHLLNLFRQQAEEKGIALTLEVAPDCLGSWLGDVFRLEQILINLISNALKFTERGSVVCRVQPGIPPPGTPVGPTAPRNWLTVTVQDTGIGLTAEQQDRLFNPFMQADSSTTRRYGGTGLGLSICKRIVDAMGGLIGVERQSGGAASTGSLFHFTIALAQAAVAAPVPAPGVGAERADWVVDLAEMDRYVAHNYHVRADPVDYVALTAKLAGACLLLVEDMPINQQVAKELLEKVGIRVDVAPDGVTAVQMAATQHYDAILMDIQMPGMDGYEATRLIRAGADALPGGAGERLAMVPIIAMTAHTLLDDQARCLAVGMNDHVSKPVDQSQLYQVLVRWIAPVAGAAEREAPLPGRGATTTVAPLPPDQWWAMPAGLPGIDVADGLGRTGGNHALYGALLQEFVREFEQTPAQVRAMLTGRRQDDLPSASQRVHAIRGMAGNLAARDLSQAAQELEQAIQAERRAAWPALLDRFAWAMRQVVTAVQTLPVAQEADPGADATGAPLDQAVVVARLTRLAGLVAEGNVESLSCLSGLKAALRGLGVGNEMQRLDACLEQFDFEGAAFSLAVIARALDFSLEPGG
ncbi:MAG: response regulator [Magnetococcales bacterium]|nr:response regulator [Magnetococcales bacterium]